MQAEQNKLDGIIELDQGPPDFQIWWFLQGYCLGMGDYNVYLRTPKYIVRHSIDRVIETTTRGLSTGLENTIQKGVARALGVKES